LALNSAVTKAVLGDLDGTLVDSEQYHWLAWRETMATQGVSLTHQQFLKTFGLRNDAIIPQWIPDATPERIQQIADAKEQLYRGLVRERGLEPLPGARHWTERLAADSWLQAIASSAPRENVDTVLAAIGLAACFQAIVSAEDVTLGKPDPQVFLTAAARLASAARQLHCCGGRARRHQCSPLVSVRSREHRLGIYGLVGRHRSRAPRRDAQHRSPPQWVTPGRRFGRFLANGPPSRRLPAPTEGQTLNS